MKVNYYLERKIPIILKIKNNIENNGLISSIGNLKISAKDIVNNKQIISDSNLNIDVDNITNKGLIYSTENTDVKFKNKFLMIKQMSIPLEIFQR